MPDDQLQILIEVSIALFLGGLIGLERELLKKPAGLRTHMLVSGVSAFLVGAGRLMVSQEAEGEHVVDPIRIIEAIVTGLSFIGAGTVIQGRGKNIEGLTTAASILFAGAIGIGVALEQYYLVVGCTILVIFVNYGLGKLEGMIHRKYRTDPDHEKYEDKD